MTPCPDACTLRPCRGCLHLLCATCPSLHHRVADGDSRLWHRTCAELARIEVKPWPGLEAIRTEHEVRNPRLEL